MRSQRFGKAWTAWVCVLLLVVASLAQANPAGSADAERAHLRAQSADVLARLYAAQPHAKPAIARAAGYATFRNLGVKVGVAGTGKGRGLAVSAKQQETFMRFVELQAGLGVGIKRYDLVFVFDTPQAFERFVKTGWQYSGQTTVAARGKQGGRALEDATAIGEGVWMYQLTSRGLAAEMTLKASNYYRDKDLN